MAALKTTPVAALHPQTSRATRRACSRRPGPIKNPIRQFLLIDKIKPGGNKKLNPANSQKNFHQFI
jgi:hypothetical protein